MTLSPITQRSVAFWSVQTFHDLVQTFIDFVNFPSQLLHVFHQFHQYAFRGRTVVLIDRLFNFFCLPVQLMSHFRHATVH